MGLPARGVVLVPLRDEKRPYAAIAAVYELMPAPGPRTFFAPITWSPIRGLTCGTQLNRATAHGAAESMIREVRNVLVRPG